MKAFLVTLLLTISATCYSYPIKPNPNISTGDFCTENDRDFKEFRYRNKIPICKRNVSYQTRNKICKLYDVEDRKNYTVDHIIPLSLGGSNSETNLWCQHRSIHSGNLEYEVYKDVREEKMEHYEAIRIIMLHKYGR